MPFLSLWLLAALFALLPPLSHAQALVQTGRYTAVLAVPTDAQRDPLQAIVTIDFPEDVQTIGQAVNLVLSDTGYKIRDVLYWDVEVFALVQHPLPLVQRKLGPLTVLDLLKTLVGRAFEVVIDPLDRRVGFEVDAQARGLGDDAVHAELQQ